VKGKANGEFDRVPIAFRLKGGTVPTRNDHESALSMKLHVLIIGGTGTGRDKLLQIFQD